MAKAHHILAGFRFLSSRNRLTITGMQDLDTTNPEFLKAALRGYEVQMRELEGHITALRERLGVKANGGKRHSISPEGRARIAAAQRKRWAKKAA